MSKKPMKKAKKPSAKLLKDKCRAVVKSAKKHAATKPGSAPEAYHAIAGLSGPPERHVLAISIRPIVRAASGVLQELEKKRQLGKTEFARMSIALPTDTNLDRITIDVSLLHKLKTLLRKTGLKNGAGMIQLRSRPADNMFGCKLHATVELVIYDLHLSSTFFDAAHEKLTEKYGADGDTIRVELIEATSDGLKAAVTSVFDLSEGDTRALEKAADGVGVEDWAKRKPLRSFCRFMTLAFVPFQHMLYGFGDGKRLVSKAMVDSRHTLDLMKAEKPQIIHRDEIARFFASELIRLRMKHFELPFVRYR